MHITEEMGAGMGVRSLSFSHGEEDFSVMLVLPGTWNLGRTQRLEVISVLKGSITINKKRLEEGKLQIVGLDCPIHIVAEEPAVLYCTYGPIPK